MTDFQFWVLFGTAVSFLTGGIGWLISWIKSVDRKTSELEIDIAVLKAILDERKK
jgi:hypothetical protein